MNVVTAKEYAEVVRRAEAAEKAAKFWKGIAEQVGYSEPQFSDGHCAERSKPGGCQLHNLHCAYPECDRRPALTERQVHDATR